MNFIATVGPVGEYLFTGKINSFKQVESYSAVVNMPATQAYVEYLHSLVKQDVHFGILAAA